MFPFAFLGFRLGTPAPANVSARARPRVKKTFVTLFACESEALTLLVTSSNRCKSNFGAVFRPTFSVMSATKIFKHFSLPLGDEVFIYNPQ